MAFPTAVNSQITDAVPQSDSPSANQAPTPGDDQTDQSTPGDKSGNLHSNPADADGNETGNGVQAEDHGTGNGYSATANGHEAGNGLVSGDGAGS